jgi:CRP-like cAMP-binding protein/Zn-dependent protease
VEYGLVAIVVAAAVVIVGSDAIRQRRLRRNRIDTYAALRRSMAGPRAAVDVAAAVTSAVSAGAAAGATRDEGPEPEGIWALVEDAVDPESFRPRLLDGTEMQDFPIRWGDDHVMIARADGAVLFELEPWEAALARKMDGTRTVGEIVVEQLRGSGDFDIEGVAGLVESLRRGGFFGPEPIDLDALLPDRIDPSTNARKRLRAFVRDLRISWSGPDRVVRWAYEHGFRLLYTRAALAVMVVISVLGLAAFVYEFESGRHQLTVGPASVQTLILIGLGFLSTSLHEIAHAATLVHYGRKVRSAGFLLYYGTPAFFIDTSEGLMLPRGARMMQAFAGPFAELTVAGVTSILLFAFPESAAAPLLYKFSFINFYVVVLNLIPLLELDGYWILADGLEIPDLRPRSMAFIRREMWQKFARRERFTPQEVGLGLYGVVGTVFTIFTSVVGILIWKEVFGGIVVDLWESSLGTRILMVFLVLFFAGPAIRGLVTLGRSMGRRVRSLVRRIRFRTETAWRVEAAHAIDALPAFDDIDVDVLNDLAGRVQIRAVPRGDTIFRQGDASDAFYVVRSGSVAVEDRDPDTDDVRTLRTLGAGEAFGEIGLLTRVVRQATVRAVEDTELFRLDESSFDRLLADRIDAPNFAPTMQAYADLRALPPFARLGSVELDTLLEHGAFASFPPGEVLIHEGDVGDAFYVLASGRVRVTKDGDLLNEMGAGEHFGEIALLEDVPRTATVTASTPVRAFRLDRAGFDAVIAHAFRGGALRRPSDRTWEH